MTEVMKNSWALLLGVMLLLVGNGLQGTVLGIRGAIEGYDPATMSWVMSAYYAGFLLGSRRATFMIRNVGHVRVFAALASMISAAFVIYAAAPHAWVWIAMRFIVGFCFSGVYVVAESWLNESSTNSTRGKALSLYIIVQMLGVIFAQLLVNLGDPAGYSLFVVMSVLVSISFLPILLTVTPAPAHSTAKPMSLVQLFKVSPLGCVGMLLAGGIFAAMFGMSAVYGSEKGYSVAQISAFVAAIYTGGLVLQFPVGNLSDKMDRRLIIVILTFIGAASIFIGMAIPGDSFPVLLATGFMVGGVANPLYSLLIAYTADYLDTSDMAAASGGLLFINGLGSIAGPPTIGFLMNSFGPDMFFVYIAILFAVIGLYGMYRSTRRSSPDQEDITPYTVLTPSASAVAVEVSQEYAIEEAEREEEEAAEEAEERKDTGS
ncbi:MFS transporter [Amaricoccus tamworthensis]|uniref:MFS transporter n=1 Tax=Amaricoccus tamworthensis TaxID=57002 RepID=UPI003C7BFC5A